jgi:hypothetical protein
MRKKYIIVRKASKGLNGIQNNPNPSNYIVRRRQIRIPKAMVQRLKAQDLLKHIQQKLPELRELRGCWMLLISLLNENSLFNHLPVVIHTVFDVH